MIEVLLLIGFWLIYIFINTAVSVMSKDSLFFVLAHGTLFIIFVGLRWLLQVYVGCTWNNGSPHHRVYCAVWVRGDHNRTS